MIFNKYYIGNEYAVKNLHVFYGFPEPANEHMVSVIDMYHNTFISLSWILLGIIWFVYETVRRFHADKNGYPSYFTRWQESMIDACVVFIPLIVILYLTVPTVGYILHTDKLMQYLTSNISLEIVGHQWYWSYYLDSVQNAFLFDFLCVSGIDYTIDTLNQYVSNIAAEDLIDDEIYQFEFDQYMDIDAKGPYRYLAVTQTLVLPVHEYVRCLITSEDVIHSFALPQLGIKVDAIPGRMNAFILNASKMGVYHGQCSELCGVNHAFMPIAIEFASEAHFYDWYIKNLDVRPYKILLSLVSWENYLVSEIESYESIDEYIDDYISRFGSINTVEAQEKEDKIKEIYKKKNNNNDNNDDNNDNNEDSFGHFLATLFLSYILADLWDIFMEFLNYIDEIPSNNDNHLHNEAEDDANQAPNNEADNDANQAPNNDANQAPNNDANQAPNND